MSLNTAPTQGSVPSYTHGKGEGFHSRNADTSVGQKASLLFGGALLQLCLFPSSALSSPSLSWSPGQEGPFLDKETQLYPCALKSSPSSAQYRLSGSGSPGRGWVQGPHTQPTPPAQRPLFLPHQRTHAPPLRLAMTRPQLVAVPRPAGLPDIS